MDNEQKEVNYQEIINAIKVTQETPGYKYINDALISVITASSQQMSQNAGLDNSAIEARLKAVGRIEAATMFLNIVQDLENQLKAQENQKEVAESSQV